MSDPTIQATVSSTALNRLLHAASRAGSRSAPIYEMVQLAVRKGTLYAKCSTARWDHKLLEDQGTGFEALVNVQTLASLVSAMNGPVQLIPEPNKGLRIECGTAKAKLTGLEDALPQIDDPKAKTICSLSGEALASIPAVARGDTTLHLNGVFVDVSPARSRPDRGRVRAACETAIEGDTSRSCCRWPSFGCGFALNYRCPESLAHHRHRQRRRECTLTMSSPGRHQAPAREPGAIFRQTSRTKMHPVMVDALNCRPQKVRRQTLSAHRGNSLCVMSAATSMGQYHNVVGNAGETLSIYLHPHITDGLSLLETPEVVFTGARGPLGLQDGSLRMVFMPMIVEEPISQAEAEPEETEAPIAVEVPVAADA
jgi:hypothetical protein